MPVTQALSIGNHCVRVHTGNGRGSTNTKIRKFTTTEINVGTAITYATSATAGASFTINEPGIYAVDYSDGSGSAGTNFGVSKNSAQLTTSVYSMNVADRLAVTTVAFGGYPVGLSCEFDAVAGDVIRPHDDGAMNEASNLACFTIRKVSK